MRDYALETTFDIKFTTRRFTTGVPFALASGVISAYPGNSITQITAGITLTADFDGVVGLNNVRVVATTANGYVTNTNYALVITTGTVDSVSVVGEVVGEFSIEAQSPLRPTVAGRTLDVSAGGEGGLDWANIGSPTTAQNLSGTNIDVDQIVASVSGAVGSVTGLTATTVHSDLDDIQARLPAALDANGVMKTASLYALGAVWIDTGGGAAGTTNYTHGTVTNPNSSMANSRTIADSLNLNIFHILNASSVTLDQGYTGYQFSGARWNLALASRLITNSHFTGATVSGLSTGTGSEWDDCSVDTVTIANDSTFRNCGLNGTFTCQAAGNYTFTDCNNNSPSGTDWILDFAALGATTVGVREFAGAMEVRNMAAGDILGFTGSGRLTIAASCTAGTVLISGTVNLVNNGSGQTISDSARWNEDQRLANVTLVDTLTTYTGNTPQTGDVFPLVSTEIADIKAKTDNLPSDPADASVVAGLIAAVEAKVDIIDTNVDSILVDTGTTLDAAIADLPTNAELATALGTADDAVLAQVALVKAQTDQMVFTTPGQIDATAVTVSDKTGYTIAASGVPVGAFAANSITASALATDAANEIRDAVHAKVVEAAGSYTLQQAISIILAVLAGVTTDDGATLKTPDGSATRVAATVNASNERTAMTITPSA